MDLQTPVSTAPYYISSTSSSAPDREQVVFDTEISPWYKGSYTLTPFYLQWPTVNKILSILPAFQAKLSETGDGRAAYRRVRDEHVRRDCGFIRALGNQVQDLDKHLDREGGGFLLVGGFCRRKSANTHLDDPDCRTQKIMNVFRKLDVPMLEINLRKDCLRTNDNKNCRPISRAELPGLFTATMEGVWDLLSCNDPLKDVLIEGIPHLHEPQHIGHLGGGLKNVSRTAAQRNFSRAFFDLSSDICETFGQIFPGKLDSIPRLYDTFRDALGPEVDLVPLRDGKLTAVPAPPTRPEYAIAMNKINKVIANLGSVDVSRLDTPVESGSSYGDTLVPCSSTSSPEDSLPEDPLPEDPLPEDPLPEGSGPEDSPLEERPLEESPSEESIPDDSLPDDGELFVSRMQAQGFSFDAIFQALDCTSLRHELAEKVLFAQRAGRTLPFVAGVWTPEDDLDLQDGDGRARKRQRTKHGAAECEARLKWLAG